MQDILHKMQGIVIALIVVEAADRPRNIDTLALAVGGDAQTGNIGNGGVIA